MHNIRYRNITKLPSFPLLNPLNEPPDYVVALDEENDPHRDPQENEHGDELVDKAATDECDDHRNPINSIESLIDLDLPVELRIHNDEESLQHNHWDESAVGVHAHHPQQDGPDHIVQLVHLVDHVLAHPPDQVGQVQEQQHSGHQLAYHELRVGQDVILCHADERLGHIEYRDGHEELYQKLLQQLVPAQVACILAFGRIVDQQQHLEGQENEEAAAHVLHQVMVAPCKLHRVVRLLHIADWE